MKIQLTTFYKYFMYSNILYAVIIFNTFKYFRKINIQRSTVFPANLTQYYIFKHFIKCICFMIYKVTLFLETIKIKWLCIHGTHSIEIVRTLKRFSMINGVFYT